MNLQTDTIVPTAEEIHDVLAILTRATNAKRPMLPSTPMERRLHSLEQWFLSHAVHAAVVMFAVGLLAIYFESQPMRHTVLALAAISETLVIAMFIVGIVGGILFVQQLRKSPYAPFLRLVESSAEHDLTYVRELAPYSKHVLQYMLIHYKQERNGYERRSGMLAGAIDKVGIVPALAGLVLLTWNLMKVPGSTAWGTFFGPLLLAFYFLSLASSHMTQKMDRVIALLEFVIQARKS